MQPVISEEEGWRPLIGSRLSEPQQKPACGIQSTALEGNGDVNEQHLPTGCWIQVHTLPCGQPPSVMALGGFLRVCESFWGWGEWHVDGHASHQHWHLHKKRNSPLLTSGGLNFPSRSRSNIKGWGRRRNGPCKRGHIRAIFLFNYSRPFLAVLASLVHCSWQSCTSSKIGFSSFCTSLPQHLEQIFFISQQLRTLCSMWVQLGNIDAGAKAFQMIENLQGTLQY